ncbi:MAG: hypothetical protein NZV14_05595 [Bryobacteraceae bacterium]|nr:hypothetical protein [Bryobacteraceae bacterium]MDW8377612.1 hypothetical protein [Bryobacterales bacterium]
MSKYELSKSVEARKLNPRTGQPTNDPPATIPYGAILDKVEFDGDFVRFVYLMERYQAQAEHVKGALTALGGAAEVATAAGARDQAEGTVENREATRKDFKLRFEPLSSNHGLPLYRTAIPGGWLVTNASFGAVTFVPDPEHRWDGSSVK